MVREKIAKISQYTLCVIYAAEKLMEAAANYNTLVIAM